MKYFLFFILVGFFANASADLCPKEEDEEKTIRLGQLTYIVANEGEDGCALYMDSPVPGNKTILSGCKSIDEDRRGVKGRGCKRLGREHFISFSDLKHQTEEFEKSKEGNLRDLCDEAKKKVRVQLGDVEVTFESGATCNMIYRGQINQCHEVKVKGNQVDCKLGATISRVPWKNASQGRDRAKGIRD